MLGFIVIPGQDNVYEKVHNITSLNTDNYAPNFEKVDGAYCFWSMRAWVGAWVTLFVPNVTFKPLKLES